jgi:hypothetical protein
MTSLPLAATVTAANGNEVIQVLQVALDCTQVPPSPGR